jgi:hypothetical protein
MCLLSQTSGLATDKLIIFVTYSFVGTFRAAIYTDSRKLLAATPICTGLVEKATERICRVSLHGKKCSQADSPKGYHDFRKWALKGPYK